MKINSLFIFALVCAWRCFSLCDVTAFSFVDNTKKLTFSPLVVNTWPFTNATAAAWKTLVQTDDPIQAVVAGCSRCEELQCDGTVGYGGSPDEHAESALDAVIMDGLTHDAGAVASMKRVRNAIGVALAVMRYTKHTMLVGEGATRFAIEMGFQEEDLHTIGSMTKWISWQNASCQPNFRMNVVPDATKSCGPYKPISEQQRIESAKTGANQRYNKYVNDKSHDTIGMLSINSKGNIAGGTSTNGATHKISGRVGDSPIIGSGVYVDNEIGGACGTGDGDTLMKFLPAYQAVESMRRGMSPSEAAQDAINRVSKVYQNFVGAIVAINKAGEHGAGCHGLPTFKYSYADLLNQNVKIAEVTCV